MLLFWVFHYIWSKLGYSSWQDRDSEGNEGAIKKRREGEEREEKVLTLNLENGGKVLTWCNPVFKFIQTSILILCIRGAQDTEMERTGKRAQAGGLHLL